MIDSEENDKFDLGVKGLTQFCVMKKVVCDLEVSINVQTLKIPFYFFLCRKVNQMGKN